MAPNGGTQPRMAERASELIEVLRTKSEGEVKNLMDLSDKLASLNVSRYKTFSNEPSHDDVKSCLFAFQGDVYRGMRADDFSSEEVDFAQGHIRILSGLYGLLRPLDCIQPYRLEMGTRLSFDDYNTLYDYWGSQITIMLNEDLQEQGDPTVINLASQEYFKSVQEKKLQGKILTPVFKDEKNGHFKIVSFYAKKARGLMSSFLIRNRIDYVEGLFDFSEAGYRFSTKDSTELSPVFLRSEKNRAAA